MLDITEVFETRSRAFNAPFTGCFQEDKDRLMRLGAINDNETPREDVIRILARAFAAAFYDGYVGRSGREDDLIFVQGVLTELWSKGEVYAVYLYIAFLYESEMAGTPEKLTWMSKREDLLRSYLGYFMEAFEELMNNFEDNAGKA